jgi:uncharacterized damage-inducible protein DinB
MSTKKIVANLSQYNAWANCEIARWLHTVDEKIVTQKTPSSFESIGLTIQHITMVQRFWSQFVREGNPVGFNWKAQEKEVKYILEDLCENSKKITDDFSSFSEEELQVRLELDQKWLQNKLIRYEYILHCLNHSTFHRGQIVTMARSNGIVQHIPHTDYNVFNSKK